MKKIFLALFVLLMMLVLTHTATQSGTGTARKIIVSGTGDSTKLMKALADDFVQKNGGKYIVEVPEAIGSTAGIKALVRGEADIARIARQLKENEQQLGIDYEIFAGTAVVFVVNPNVTEIDNITTDQILDVYSGKITDWKELGAKPGKIYPLTRELGDSSLKVFSKTFPEFTSIPEPVAKVMFLTPETVAALLKYKNTIGFVPYASVVGTELKVLKINGVEPSAENITAGRYKHVIPLGIAYKSKPRPLVKKFIDYLHTEDARKIIEKMGAVPGRPYMSD